MYETSVGHNSPVIIDFAPMPNGSIPDAQVAAAATLGAFVRGCYGAPLATTHGSGQGGDYLVTLPMPGGAPATIDRVLASEDYAATSQQRVRGFTLTAALSNGGSVDLLSGGAGSSIGAKFISVLPAPVADVVSVTLNVTAARGSPFIRELAVYACDGLAARLDAQWKAQGHPPAAHDWAPKQRYVRPWGRRNA